MEELDHYRQQLLDRLASQVDDLREIVAKLPAGQAPRQTLARLRAVEAQAWLPRLTSILAEDNPEIAPFDDQAWMQEHGDPTEAPESILEDFAGLRERELARLRDVPAAGWNRAGRHPLHGARTLQWWVESQVACTEDYLRQLRVARAG